MKYCCYCHVLNDENLKTCKICGRKLDLATQENKKIPPYNDRRSISKRKTKYKTKVRSRTKTKTVVRDDREKGKMSFLQKFFVFILFNFCLILIGVCAYLGYHIYKTENIEVPDVVGSSYERAEVTLKNLGLDVIKNEKEVDDSEVGLVISQNKRRASSGDSVKLTVGIEKSTIKVPRLTGLSLEKATSILNENNIKYKIIYEDANSDGVVIKQSVSANDEIEVDGILKITVSKKMKKDMEKLEDDTLQE